MMSNKMLKLSICCAGLKHRFARSASSTAWFAVNRFVVLGIAIFLTTSISENTAVAQTEDSRSNGSARSTGPGTATTSDGLFSITVDNGQLIVTPDAPKESVIIKTADSVDTISPSGGKVTSDFETDSAGKLVLIQQSGEASRLFHISSSRTGRLRLKLIPLWLSIVPPLIAIIAAFLLREVVVAMFLGLWAGAIIAGGIRFDSLYFLLRSPMTVVDTFVLNAMNDSGHLSVILFSLLIGGVVAVTSRNGGMTGIANVVASLANSARGSMLATWLLGVVIFFDDYANTLIVGNTMRPITDRYRISREKLAFLVDCTAAPIAAVAFISTWIGAELGYIEDGLKQLRDFDANIQPYGLFLESLKYACYPALMLMFTLYIVVSGRDFGLMLKAERKARHDSEPSHDENQIGENQIEDEVRLSIDITPSGDIPHRWWNGAIPILVLVTVTLVGLVDTSLSSFAAEAPNVMQVSGEVPSQVDAGNHWQIGWQQISKESGVNASLGMKLGKLMGRADSYVALIWASLAALIVAVLLSCSQRLLSVSQSMEAMLDGFRLMLPAMSILVLAWALSAVVQELHTAQFLTSIATNAIDVRLFPAIVFLLAAVTAFVTGSSWSTMAILYPLVIPLTWSLSGQSDWETDAKMALLLNVIAVTLSGAVMGDHCSPISDTTILSSMASECHHLAHVKTQLPYALLVGAASLLFAIVTGFLTAGWMLSLLVMLACLAGLLAVFHRVSEPVEATNSTPIPEPESD